MARGREAGEAGQIRGPGRLPPEGRRRWKAAFAGRTAAKPSYKKKSAGIDLGRSVIIDFLADDSSRVRTAAPHREAIARLNDPLPVDSADDELWRPDRKSLEAVEPAAAGVAADGTRHTVVDGVETLAERVVLPALDDIREELGGTIPNAVKTALADHFWCDLLAHLAHAIDQGLKHIDSVPDRLTDWVMTSREQSRWRLLETRVVRAAARSVWSKVKVVTFSGLLNRVIVLPVIRLLATLMCKAPERHRAVVEYCVDPLGKGVLGTVRERLVDVLPEWLPRMSGAGR